MQALTINIKNKSTSEKILWFLKHFTNEGVEIVSQEDMEDLKLLATTRDEPSISFDEYLRNDPRQRVASVALATG